MGYCGAKYSIIVEMIHLKLGENVFRSNKRQASNKTPLTLKKSDVTQKAKET